MSRRKSSKSGNDGCMVALFPFLIVLGAIASVFQWLFENIGIVLIVVAIVGGVVGIVIAISDASKKKEAEEAEKQKNLAIVNGTEPRPSLSSIPTSTVFSSKEEEHVNTSFREFLRKNNDVVAAQTHLDYLTNKSAALHALNRSEEATQFDGEITQARTALSTAQSKRGGTFESEYNNAFYRSNDVKNAFSAFASKLPNERMPLIGDFFQSPQIKAVKVGSNSALMFTPSYVMYYTGPMQNIKLFQYKDVSVSTWIKTEILDGTRQPNDEIEHIGYRYETKDGYRDMRYRYENNPSYTFVYRGEATVRCGGATYEQKFSNKSLTEGFEKQFKAYISLLTGKYKSAVEQILAHNEEITQAGNIDTFMAQQAAVAKLKEATEKAEREKEEKIRQEREKKAEAKRRKEQAEREAAAREKQRKADFLKNLTIVDGVLTNWYGNDRDFVLPEGMVTTIGTAFRWKSNLNSVTLPEGITSIQANAFHGSTELKRVTIPSTVTDIGKEAFMGCTSLTEIKLPKGIRSITSQMFSKCASLKTISIPSGIKKIERGAFSGCSSLQEIVLPAGVTTVEDDAFENCTGLKKVVLPNSVIKLGRNIFNGCMSLETVELGNGIKHIPDACFNNQQKLKTVSIAADVVEIGERAFKNCQKLLSIEFIDVNKTASSKGMEFEMIISGSAKSASKLFALDSLERIGKSAFENCFAFEGLDLQEGLRAIGDYAFANCRSIKKINLPKSINSFGTGVFQGCIALTTVNGIENVEWHKKNSFIGSPWLATQAEDGYVTCDGYLEAYTGTATDVTIPENIKVIGKNAFDGNAYLTTVSIPMGVTTIEELAFANCRKLKSVQIADSVSRIEDNAFANDSGFVIQCTRGSAASSFRIKNKIAGEYIAKVKPTEPVTRTSTSTKRTRSTVGDGLSGLSEEELRVIMEMRREKLVQKKAEAEKPVEPEKTEYTLSEVEPNKIAISLSNDNRKITNNIFNLKFVQSDSADSGKGIAEYETFVIDSYGQVISNIKTIQTDKTGNDLTHKVSYSLSAQEKFDKSAAYYVVLRYKGSGTNILSKTQYQISIEFASDFDF